MKKPPLFVVMGVSGCGKSTIGKLLASTYGLPFFDGDDYHPHENVDKMSKGIPLEDSDRKDWLQRLNILAKEYREKGAVIACSALKKAYRDQIADALTPQMEFIYLKGTKDEILRRLEERKGHFMPAGLLDSQFQTLEVPLDAITVSIEKSPDEIVLEIIKKLPLKKP